MTMNTTMTNQPIRASVSGDKSVITEATFDAINSLIRKAGEATFLNLDTGDGNKMLVIEHPNADSGLRWCQTMNTKVFPGERGVCIGSHADSAAKTLGLLYRFPASFHHLVAYLPEGTIFYNSSNNTWEVTGPMANKEGVWEVGHGREMFVEWMRRQFARLENYIPA